MKEIFLVFGDQLFPLEYFEKYRGLKFLMIESHSLCNHFNYHKIRLAFFMSSARHKKIEFKDHNFNIDYLELNDFNSKTKYTERLASYCQKNKITKISAFEKEDKFFSKEILEMAQREKIELALIPSPAFLNSHGEFKSYLKKYKKPFMKYFYEDSRKRFNILVDKDKKPIGGKWSFDEDNRNKLKKETFVPAINHFEVDDITLKVINIINKEFLSHPGELKSNGSNFLFPVTRVDALKWLDQFLEERFYNFGEFEDALSTQHDFVFHSLLSPLINLGLLTPHEVVNKSLSYAKIHKTPLNSLEGFIRQIVGWREFIRGIYHEFSEIQDEKNYFNHQRKLNDCWYNGTTGILPVDNAIIKVTKYAYLHHIERLMVMSNIMLLCEIDPKEVHRWFNEMFIDSMDWVMGPNVYGMGQFSDGGIFATKPYICGSNYLLKMSDYPKGEWTEELDALYWCFIDKNREFFLKNPRLSMMVRTLDKMDSVKKERHLVLAEFVKNRLSQSE